MTAPFWGAQTSYLNFCEEDYVVTRYIAEFVNTISSLTFVAYGLYGLLTSPRFPSVPRLVSYCGLIGVGVCSAGYHMTLKYHTQMSDELSMHLLTTPLMFRLLTFKAGPKRTRVVGSILFALFTVVMVTHMVLDEFLLHATAFGLGIYVIVSRLRTLIPQQIHDPRIRKDVQNVASFGTLCFGFGYIVWLLDDWACRHLTNARHAVGLPVAFLLELHGWWHIFTAIGGYVAVAVIDLVISDDIAHDPINKLAWPIPLAAKAMGYSAAPAKQA